MKTPSAIAIWLLMIPALAAAQGEVHRYQVQGYAFGAFAFGTGSDHHPPVEQLGFGGEGFLYKGLGVGGEAVSSHYSLFGTEQRVWIGSVDASYHFRRHAPRGGVDPFLVGGPSGYRNYAPDNTYDPSLGGNFGGGVNLWFADHAAFRFEVREHWGGESLLPDGEAAGFRTLAFRVGVTFR